MSNIEKRHTVESLFSLKVKMLNSVKNLYETANQLRDDIRSIGGYEAWSITNHYRYQSDEKAIDQAMWTHLSRQFNLQNYMLCTEWEKMNKEIEECRTPDFTIENANAWLDSLCSILTENVKTLVKTVYADLIGGTYFVGSGYNADKKKRNNNGVDRHFILRTCDYSSVFSYYNRPTITDDLEKVCYLLDGKPLPQKTLKNIMKAEKTTIGENEYMRVEFYKNGNTHFRLQETTRLKLNKYGPSGATIGENIKIKILNRWA